MLKYRYFDKYGTELHAGDLVEFDNRTDEGRIKKLYETAEGELGTDATNPLWLLTGRAEECEYGVYPLDDYDLKHIIKIERE